MNQISRKNKTTTSPKNFKELRKEKIQYYFLERNLKNSETLLKTVFTQNDLNLFIKNDKFKTLLNDNEKIFKLYS